MARRRGRPARLTIEKAEACFAARRENPTWGVRKIGKLVGINYAIVFRLFKAANGGVAGKVAKC